MTENIMVTKVSQVTAFMDITFNWTNLFCFVLLELFLFSFYRETIFVSTALSTSIIQASLQSWHYYTYFPAMETICSNR